MLYKEGCELIEIESFDEILKILDEGEELWVWEDPKWSDKFFIRIRYDGQVYLYQKHCSIIKMYWIKGEGPDPEEIRQLKRKFFGKA